MARARGGPAKSPGCKGARPTGVDIIIAQRAKPKMPSHRYEYPEAVVWFHRLKRERTASVLLHRSVVTAARAGKLLHYDWRDQVWCWLVFT
jgi:hypothetical protein